MNTETKTLATATEKQTKKPNNKNQLTLRGGKKKSLGLNIMHGLNT